MNLIRIGSQTINMDMVTDIKDGGTFISFRFAVPRSAEATNAAPTKFVYFDDPGEIARIRSWIDKHVVDL
jgi:hypothetical protein